MCLISLVTLKVFLLAFGFQQFDYDEPGYGSLRVLPAWSVHAESLENMG